MYSEIKEPLNESVMERFSCASPSDISSHHLEAIIAEEAIEVRNKSFGFRNSFWLLKLKYSSFTCVSKNFVMHLILLLMLKCFHVIHFCGFHCL